MQITQLQAPYERDFSEISIHKKTRNSALP